MPRPNLGKVARCLVDVVYETARRHDTAMPALAAGFDVAG
jgi:hypothetical protein